MHSCVHVCACSMKNTDHIGLHLNVYVNHHNDRHCRTLQVDASFNYLDHSRSQCYRRAITLWGSFQLVWVICYVFKLLAS